MTHRLVELLLDDPWPSHAVDRGIAPIADDERRQHGSDRSLALLEGSALVARCSCWWTDTVRHEGRPTAAIGHYAAIDETAGVALLQRALELCAASGAATAIGPMDGNTWRRYRFITDRGSEPVFFLEPDNPDCWPQHWAAAGFTPVAHYTSAVNEDLRQEDPRTEPTRARLEGEGIRIRTIDPAGTDADLRRIFRLSLAAFEHNFLYTPIAEREFLGQYQAVLPYVRPELVLLAEREDQLLGFMFAMPDLLRARRQESVDTVILKTMAVHPSVAGSGLGGALLDLVQRAARRLGFRRAIHALIHESNTSRRISNRYARTVRRYALFSRALSA